MQLIHELVYYVESFAHSSNAIWALFAISFAESSFFPIPPDTLMIPLALSNIPWALFYAFVATVASVVGGVFGYWLGKKGGKPVLMKFVNEEKVHLIKDYYNKYDIWAIVIAGFTPIPYKVFTISAGVFDLDLKRFILASIIGRGGRFFLVALMILVFGPTIQVFLDNNFELVVVGLTVALLGGFIFLHKFSGKLSHAKKSKDNKETPISPLNDKPQDALIRNKALRNIKK